MDTTGLPPAPLRTVIRHELQAIRGKWIWLVVLGITLVVLGMIMFSFPVITTLATVTVLGAFILVGGIMETVAAFWCRDWSGFLLALLSGILGTVVGLMLLGNPALGSEVLAILLASFLLVGGTFKFVAAIAYRLDGWFWLLASGVIDFLLGAIIWRGLPWSGLTIIGLLVGISAIFRGVTWLMIGVTLKQVPKPSGG